MRSKRDTHLKASFILITQQMILIVALWLFSHGENGSDPERCENSGAILQRINLQFVVSEELKASKGRQPNGVAHNQRTPKIS